MADVGQIQARPVLDGVLDLSELKRRSVRGGFLTFASQTAGMAIQFASTVILARMLGPGDYGLVAMASAVTALAGVFRDLGLSSAAIQKERLTRSQQCNLFWINVAVGCAITVMLAAGSPIVALFYGNQEVSWITRALATTFAINSLSVQSSTTLLRRLMFGRKAVADVSGGLIGMFVAVTLAANGFRYWSLVLGQIAGALTTTCLLFLLSPFRPGAPSLRSGTKELLRFGGHVTMFDLVNYLHRNLDKILIGRFCGTESLGLYNRAYALLMLPISNIRAPINAVAFPAMSKLGATTDVFRLYYRRIASVVALLSMPLAAFMFTSARSIIELALGPRWSGAAAIFQILALVSFIQPVLTLWGVVMLSSGRSKEYFYVGVFHAMCMSCGFLCGIPFGATGVAGGYCAMTYITAVPILKWAFSGTCLRIGDFVAAVRSPLLASMVSACCSYFITGFYESILPPPLRVAVAAMIFAALYVGILISTSGGAKEIRYLLSAVRGAWCNGPD